MLRSLKDLDRFVLVAHDGEIGRCKDFLFDDRQWIVRYMVADTGRWIPDRKVVISPESFGEPNWVDHRFPVDLTKEQIEHAPPLTEHEPVARQQEAELRSHFGLAPYWPSTSIWGPSLRHHAVEHDGRGGTDGARAVDGVPESESTDDPDLRSLHEVVGYRVHATDDDMGHVQDLIVDDQYWAVRYLVVDTRAWLAGRKVLISPRWLHHFDAKAREARIDLTPSQIEASPEYEPTQTIHRAFEADLHEGYGREGYWNDDEDAH